jgi:uncharacterized protein
LSTTRGPSAVFRRVCLTLLAGTLGGMVFWWLRLPAPWLSGAMVGIVGMIALGGNPLLPLALRDFGMLLAGVVTGSAITPEMLAIVARYPASLVILFITTVGIVIGGQITLVNGFGWDKATSMLSAVPGAVSAVVAMVDAAGGNMLRILVLQAFRLFVLIALLPGVVLMSTSSTVVAASAPLPPGAFALVMALALVLSMTFSTLGMIAPFLLGGVTAAGCLEISGTVSGSPPAVFASVAMVLVGTFAGSRLSGIDLKDMRELLIPSVVLFVVTVAISAVGALAASWLLDLPLAQTLVAYSPGGLEAMIMLGIALGLDPLYVTAHHVARFLMIAAILPVIVRSSNR